MLNFELPTYVNDIERVITKSLAQNQKPSSDFRWYLSIHLDRAIPYNAQHNGLADDKSSYSGIKPILYQRSEFYANNNHFSQFLHQHQNIHKADKPGVYLAWLNAVQPHSLSGQKAAQELCDELIENTPFTTQVAYKQRTFEKADPSSLMSKETTDTTIFNLHDESVGEAFANDLPNNEHVDFLFESVAEALAAV